MENKFEPNITVSIFKNDEAGKFNPQRFKTSDLFTIANQIKNSAPLKTLTEEYRALLDEYGKKHKKTTEKKASFPMFSPTGQFTYKNYENYVDGSYNWVCPFDIDLADNPDLDFAEARFKIEQDEHVLFLTQSASRGLKGLLAFDYEYTDPDSWKDTLKDIVYPVLENRWGVKLDPNQSPFSQGMWFSHDPHVHVNLEPKPYKPSTELRPIPEYRPGIKYNADYTSIERFLNILSEAEEGDVFETIKKQIPILARMFKGGTLDLSEEQILDLAVKAVHKAPGTSNPKKGEMQVLSAWKNAIRKYEPITQDHLKRKEFLDQAKFWIKTGWSNKNSPYALVGTDLIYEIKSVVNGRYYATRGKASESAIKLRVNDNEIKAQILRDMPKCDQFILEPDFINFQKIIDNCYNLCWELPIKPVKGPWPTIEKSLRHSFTKSIDWNGLNGYDFQLDWECLLMRKPKQKLPGLIWKSKVHGRAGKTELFKRLQKMLGYNAVKVRMTDMTNKFNGTYADKILSIIDETEYGDFKQNESLNSIFKNLIDGDTTIVEFKGMDGKEIPNHNHLILVSNKNKPILIEPADKRWHVVDMPLYEEHEIDPLISQKFADELPHYLHYLLYEHEIKFPKESRLWFNEDALETKAKKEIQISSTNQLYFSFIEAMVDYFIENPKETEKKFSMETLKQFLDVNEIPWYKNTKALNEMMCEELELEKKPLKIAGKTSRGWVIPKEHPAIKKQSGEIDSSGYNLVTGQCNPETTQNVFDLDGFE